MFYAGYSIEGEIFTRIKTIFPTIKLSTNKSTTVTNFSTGKTKKQRNPIYPQERKLKELLH
jgi:hypothetical protein